MVCLMVAVVFIVYQFHVVLFDAWYKVRAYGRGVKMSLVAIEVDYGMGMAEHMQAVGIDDGVVAKLVAEHDPVFAAVQGLGCAA